MRPRSGDENHEVFISYSWDSEDHKASVRSFADYLRQVHVDAWIDQFSDPEEPWQRWCYKQIRDAKYVLIVCTKIYAARALGEGSEGTGRGVDWEGAIISEGLYDQLEDRRKYVPIVFHNENKAYRPYFLPGRSIFNVSDQEEFLDLYAKLTGQPRFPPSELGPEFVVPQRPVARGVGVWNPAGWVQPDISHERQPTRAPLDDVIEGSWYIDTSHPVLGSQTILVSFRKKAFGKRVFEAEGVVGPPGWRASGSWKVLAPGNRLVVSGVQSSPYGAGPFTDSYAFESIDRQAMQAVTAHNVLVTWRRA